MTECESCDGSSTIMVRPAGYGHEDDLAEYEPCPECRQREESVPQCEYCGDGPVERTVWMRDVTDTDRGDWAQEYTMNLCSGCAAKMERRC